MTDVTFTYFPDLAAREATELTLPDDGFLDWLRTLPEYPDKAACPLISMNRYDGTRTDKGAVRSNASIAEVHGVIGDYDAGALAPIDALAILQAVGVLAFIVTTPSHGIKGNRWRVILPFSQPTGLEERHQLLGKANTLLGGVLANESFTASQAFYVGRVAGVEYFVGESKGEPLDRLPGDIPFTGPERASRPAAQVTAFELLPKRAGRGIEDLRAVLDRIPNDEPDWEKWNRIGMAIFTASAGSPEGLEVWREWSDRCPTDGADSVDARWRHYVTSPPTELGMGTLVHLAGGRSAIAPQPPVPEPPAVPEPQEGYFFEIVAGGKGNTTLEAAGMLERHVSLAWDDFKQRIVVLTVPPWDPASKLPRSWLDVDTIEAQTWMQQQMMRPSKDAVFDAALMLANRRRTHPVRNYLASLQWDGMPRLDTWLVRYVGAQDTEFVRAAGAKFLISAIARIMRPGCKADHMLVLDGEQGTGKSSTAATLVPDDSWFTDELPDVRDKDAAMQLHGAWLVEVAEMDAVRRAEATAIKKFVTRRVDRYRPPYGRVTVDVPRQCVFFGTANDLSFNDHTGNRRYWPVEVEQCDVAALSADRDQIWAEALHRYEAGDVWYFERSDEHRLAKPEQSSRTNVPGAAEVLEAIEEGKQGFSGGWVSSIALNHLLERHQLTRAVPVNRRRALLQSLGYDWHPALPDGRVNNPTALDGGGRPRLFVRSGHTDASIRKPAEVVKAYEQAQQNQIAKAVFGND